MLATFIIGLREGLEAALIVGIIAAFLRNNGRGLLSMWIGVAAAVVLSAAIGIGLELIQGALPQAQQEALESVIGFIAVFFVTSMIVWMHNHARDMKKHLESDASRALTRSSSIALAVMAFLAVLKEGFETSVFLLATFSAAQSAAWAASGAALGLVVSAALGWGIYAGGVRINLGRFFHYTAAFLVLVAAGLVISSLRTAHEAGWIVAGQQPTLNLAWLVAPGTVQSALVTGVLGIPADPRLIEVIGWLAYLVPVALYVYWPQSSRPNVRTAAWLKSTIAAALLVAAAGLAVMYPRPALQVADQASLVTGAGKTPAGQTSLRPATASNGTVLQVAFADGQNAQLRLPAGQGQPERHKNIDSQVWTLRNTTETTKPAGSLTLQQVVTLAGGRVPVGLHPEQHPGPYQAHWRIHHATRIWRAHGVLFDALSRGVATVTLSGGGLSTPRTFRVASQPPTARIRNWQVAPAYVEGVQAAVHNLVMSRTQRTLWAVHVPIVLVIIAFCLWGSAARTLLRCRRRTNSAARSVSQDNIKGEPTYAAH